MTNKGFSKLKRLSGKKEFSEGAKFMIALAGYRIFRSCNDKEVYKYQAYASGLSAQSIISGNSGYYVSKK